MRPTTLQTLGVLATAALVAGCTSTPAPQTAAPPEPAPSTTAGPTTTPSDPAVDAATAPRDLAQHVVASFEVDLPSGFAVGPDAVYVPNRHGASVTVIDPVTNTVREVWTGVGQVPKDVVVHDGTLWVASALGPMHRVDTATGESTALGEQRYAGVAAGFGSIWATSLENTIDRIDPATGTVMATIPVAEGPVDCNNYVTVSPTAVWVGHCDALRLLRIDPATSTITHVREGDEGGMPAYGDGQLVAVAPDAVLWIDERDGSTTDRIDVTAEQVGLGFFTVAAGDLWLGGHDRLTSVDLAARTVAVSYAFDGTIERLAEGFGDLWIQSDPATVLRLDVLDGVLS